MKTDKKIHEHYNKHMEFYGDNWSCAFDDMVHFRIMVEDAHSYVARQAGSPMADAWLKQYDAVIRGEKE